MKLKYLAAAALAVVGVSSQAVSLVFTPSVIDPSGTRTEIFNIPGLPVLPVGSNVSLGSVAADGPGTLSVTYLGQESGAFDSFSFTVGGGSLTEANAVGTTISSLVAGGLLPFKFTDSRGGSAFNGGVWSPGTSIGLIGTNQVVGGKSYALVLGYNDSAGEAKLGDWDDYVVGLNIAAIPEPETYALLLGGLGVMGFVARRRRAQ